MATDGPTPPPCTVDIYKKGQVIFMTSTIPSNAMEGWVRAIAEKSGQRVDWHFVGGRAVVLYLGDRAKVYDAIVALLPEHDRLYRLAVQGYGLGEMAIEHLFFDEDGKGLHL